MPFYYTGHFLEQTIEACSIKSTETVPRFHSL